MESATNSLFFSTNLNLNSYYSTIVGILKLNFSAQEELSGKSRELESTNNTIDLLKTDQRELEKQIQKFSKMENKLKLEALNLKKGIEIMTNKMKEFGNLDFLKSEEERRTNDLEAAKLVLSDEISELKVNFYH